MSRTNGFALFRTLILSRGEYNKDTGAMLLLLCGDRILRGGLSMSEVYKIHSSVHSASSHYEQTFFSFQITVFLMSNLVQITTSCWM